MVRIWGAIVGTGNRLGRRCPIRNPGLGLGDGKRETEFNSESFPPILGGLATLFLPHS